MCTCNPGTQEAKAEGLCTGGQLRTLSKILSQNKTKQTTKDRRREGPRLLSVTAINTKSKSNTWFI